IRPTSVITSPASGATVPTGSPVTITGTASDGGGGVVAGVEVSVDGGATWHPATGRNNWTYTWTPNAAGSVTLKSRAVDDSGTLELPSAGVPVNVLPSGSSIWSSATTPGTLNDPDASAIEVGLKFRADQNGTVSGVRFYKGSQNTGTHVGSLWTSTGTLRARAAFTQS